MAEEYISLKPSDAVHGGGMVQEGDYEITDALFAMWDYNGTVAVSVPALAIEYTNADNQSSTQYYSAGDSRNMAPAEGGKRLKKVGSINAINDSTNCFQFLRALVNAGYPEDKLGNDIGSIVGMKVAVVHEAVAAREIKGQTKKAGVIAVIGKIHSMPGEKVKAAGKAAAKSSGGSSKGNGAVDQATLIPAATEALLAALKDADGQSMEKKKLTSAVFKKIDNGNLNRSAILNLVIQDSFLESLGDVGVVYDPSSGSVIYAGA